MGERRRGHGRGASPQAFQSGGAEGEGETLKKPHPSTPNGAGRGALAPVAASVLPHRRGRGRLILKGSGGPPEAVGGGGSGGRGARPGQARGPARPARGGEAAAAPRPAPRPQAPPAAQAPRESAAGRAAAAAPGSLRRAGGRAGTGPTQEGASRSLQREVGRAGRRS